MKSIEELKDLKEKVKTEISNREKECSARIEIAMATCGITAGAREAMNAILEEIKARNLQGVHVSQTGCPGLCYLEPLVTVIKPDETRYMYCKVTPERAKKIVAQHIVNDQPIKEWLVNLEE